MFISVTSGTLNNTEEWKVWEGQPGHPTFRTWVISRVAHVVIVPPRTGSMHVDDSQTSLGDISLL